MEPPNSGPRAYVRHVRASLTSCCPIPVELVLDDLNAHRPEPLAYTTVMTVMNWMVAKNVLRRNGQPMRHRLWGP